MTDAEKRRLWRSYVDAYFRAQEAWEAERLQATMAELDAKEKAAFVERMKAARLSKAQRRVSTTAQH